jgi:hypothetical protein
LTGPAAIRGSSANFRVMELLERRSEKAGKQEARNAGKENYSFSFPAFIFSCFFAFRSSVFIFYVPREYGMNPILSGGSGNLLI